MRHCLTTAFTSILMLVCSHVQASVLIPKAPALNAKSYVLMDAYTGQILVEKQSDKRMAPASLTKMMTSYIAVHEIAQGNVSEDTPVPISVKAWKKGGSKMFVREGTQVKLMDLLRGIIVQSGNDASVAVAEYFAGSEDAFADLMNQYVDRFGMTNTHFKNATGWPADGHYASAHDLAILARHIIQDHPNYYRIYSEKSFKYNNIKQPNRNKLLVRDPTVDGLKTGHTDEAGFCLTASAVRDGTRLIAVVMGTRSDEARASETQKLLSYGFRYYETSTVHKARVALAEPKVWLGEAKQVGLGLEEPLVLSLPRGAKDDVTSELEMGEYIEAPIKAGQRLGTLTVTQQGEVIATRPLVALSEVPASNWFTRLLDQIVLFFTKLLS